MYAIVGVVNAFMHRMSFYKKHEPRGDATQPGCAAQSVTCLATDACLTADPGVASSIPVWSHTFVEMDFI